MNEVKEHERQRWLLIFGLGDEYSANYCLGLVFHVDHKEKKLFVPYRLTWTSREHLESYYSQLAELLSAGRGNTKMVTITISALLELRPHRFPEESALWFLGVAAMFLSRRYREKVFQPAFNDLVADFVDGEGDPFTPRIRRIAFCWKAMVLFFSTFKVMTIAGVIGAIWGARSWMLSLFGIK